MTNGWSCREAPGRGLGLLPLAIAGGDRQHFPTMTLIRFGPEAWLLRFADRADEAAFAESLKQHLGEQKQVAALLL